MAKLNFTKAAIDALQEPLKGWAYRYDTKTRGLAIGISKCGARSFVFYRKVQGRPERITIGRYPDLSIEQARGKAAEFNSLIAMGENPADKRRTARREMTLQKLFDEYLERHSKRNKRTWREDVSKFNTYLAGSKQGFNLADKKLSRITRADIAHLHSKITKTHPVTANRVLALVSSIFGRALEWGLWDAPNPARSIRHNPEKDRDRFLRANELPKFFAALAEEPSDVIRDYFLLSLLTGARRSNVLAMRWRDIGLAQKEWHIPDTKNGTPQVIPLTDEAVAVLAQRKASAPEEFVFPASSKSGHLVAPDKAWSRILKRADLEDVRIHDLRRTLGSWQAKTGASLVIIGKSLNHKDPSVTAIYSRLDLDPVRESVRRATSAMLIAAGLKSDAEGVALNYKQSD